MGLNRGIFITFAIGNFDGVHIGHQKIISSLVNYAKKNNKPSAILSFNPHPILLKTGIT